MISLNFFSPFSPLVWVELSFHNALEKAGIEDFKIHNLRHTFTSNILISRVDLITFRELLGHKTIDIDMLTLHRTIR
jgi:integrase